jgi:hypothetical protein
VSGCKITRRGDLDFRLLSSPLVVSCLTAGFVFQFFCLLAFSVDSPASSALQPVQNDVAGPVM